MKSFLKKSLAALFILTVVNGILYFPGRYLPFLEDQIIYMADLNGDYSLPSVMARWDYSNARIYWRGDESLVRPFFMGWLGLLGFFFGNHYPCWNAAHLALHILVCLCLFLLLSRSVDSKIALLFSLGFSVSPHLLGLTTDVHLGGYLWPCALFVLFILQIFEMQEDAAPWTDARILLLAATMLCCLMFFEIFIVLLPPFLLYLMAGRALERKQGFSRKQFAVLAAPFALFVLVYIGHVLGAERFFFTGPGINLSDRLGSHRQYFADSFAILSNWLMLLVSRPLEPRSFFEITWGALLLFSFFTDCSFRKITRILLLGSCLYLYVLFIAIGRPAPHIHHYYFFFLLIWIILFYSVDGKRFPWMLSVLLIGFTAAGAETTWNSLKASEPGAEAQHAYFSQVKKFVAQHKREPGFSFRIENAAAPELDPMHALKRGYADQSGKLSYKSKSQILFSKFYDAVNPRYVLTWNGRSFRADIQKRTPEAYALQKKIFGLTNISERSLEAMANKIPDGSPGIGGGCVVMPNLDSGVLLTSAVPRKAVRIEISTDSWDSYLVEFYLNGVKKGELPLPLEQPPKGGTLRRVFPMPDSMLGQPFNQVLVRPVDGDGIYSLAYFILDPIEKEVLQKKYGISWILETDLDKTSTRAPDGVPGNRPGFFNMPDVQSGVLLRSPVPREARKLEISTDSWDSYRIEFYLDGSKKGELFLPLVQPPRGGAFRRVLSMPENMRGQKFDEILVKPVAGDGIYSLVYLILDPA